MLSLLSLTCVASNVYAQENVLRIDGQSVASLNPDAVPLCVVDGVVVEYSALGELQSSDIFSVTMLVDSNSVAEYAHLGDVSNGVLVIELAEPEEVFISVDEMPKFMNGDLSTFQGWVMQNMRYPAEALESNIQGIVVVQFIVGSDGYIRTDDIEILQSPSELLHNEVLRVMSLSPRWTPGVQRGNNVAVTFALPISFSLQGDI